MKPYITMSVREPREFSLDYEIGQLKKMLRLPITNVVFDDRYEYGKQYLNEELMHVVIYAKLYVEDDFIGTIPYMSGNCGPMYDTSRQRELPYDRVYERFDGAILKKIIEQEPLAKAFGFREDVLVDVMDGDHNKINTAFLEYIEDEWNITLTGLNPVLETESITFGITAPPPPNA